MRSRKVCVGFVLFFMVACSGGGGSDGGGTGGSTSKDSGPLNCSDAGAGTSFPCDVAPIIKSKCQRCHDHVEALAACIADNSCLEGPFPLLTWSDTRRKVGTAFRVIDLLPGVIEKRAMPPMDPTIQPPIQPLTDAERNTMLAWIRSCAPPATAACSP